MKCHFRSILPATLTAVAICLAVLPDSVAGFVWCFKMDHNGLLSHPSFHSVKCMKRICYENYYAVQNSSHLMYEAGCDNVPLKPAPKGSKYMEELHKVCHYERCNFRVKEELQSNRMVCHWADGQANSTGATVACLKNETLCYRDILDDSTYKAGCGPCPADSSPRCATCNTNLCNATISNSGNSSASSNISADASLETEDYITMGEGNDGNNNLAIRSLPTVDLLVMTSMLSLNVWLLQHTFYVLMAPNFGTYLPVLSPAFSI